MCGPEKKIILENYADNHYPSISNVSRWLACITYGIRIPPPAYNNQIKISILEEQEDRFKCRSLEMQSFRCPLLQGSRPLTFLILQVLSESSYSKVNLKIHLER